MEQTAFQKLKYGNVIVNDFTGQRAIVQQVVRDAAGNAVYVGLTPAIDARDGFNYSVTDSSHGETFIENNLLKGRTVRP